MYHRVKLYTKALAAFAFLLFFVLAAAVPAFASGGAAPPEVSESPEVRVVIDGIQGVYTDVALKINDRILLPFREVLTRLGVPNDDEHIIWNEDEESVTVLYGENTIRLVVGNPKMSLNGVDKTFDVAPFFYSVNNRTYVPVRAVSELLNKIVDWEDSNTTVYIRDKANYDETLKLLERMNKVDALKKVHAETESTIKIKITTNNLPLPGAGEDGAVRLSMDMSQLVMADLDAKTYHTKQMVNVGGVVIGSEVFMYNNKVFMRNEGSAEGWQDATGQSVFDISALLEQVNVMEGQMNARDPAKIAMGLASVRSSDGTYTIVGEPITITDVNSVLNSVSELFPQGDIAGQEMKFNKYHIGTTVGRDLYPVSAAVLANIDLIVKDPAGTGSSLTVLFNIEMNMKITYNLVQPDYKLPIPDEIKKLI